MPKQLRRWATDDPTKRFVDLYSLLGHDIGLRVAAQATLSKKGSETAGLDHMTQANFLGDDAGHIAGRREARKAQTCAPVPVRRVSIPKPSSAKTRPRGIPVLDDRMVQEALRMILAPLWDADCSTPSSGFRPHRSTYDAMTSMGKRLTGNGRTYPWIIAGDRASDFDPIPHRRLIKAVKKRIADRDIRDLLWKFLRAGVRSRGHGSETLTGTPQGGIVTLLTKLQTWC